MATALPTADSLPFVKSLEKPERDIIRDLREVERTVKPLPTGSWSRSTAGTQLPLAFAALDALDRSINLWYAAEVRIYCVINRHVFCCV